MGQYDINQPALLSLFVGIPLCLICVIWSWWRFSQFQKKLQHYPFLYKQYLPSWKRRIMSTFAICASLSSLIIAIADPVYKARIPLPVYRGVRLFFMIDVSRSMTDCEDIAPTRLEATKQEIAGALHDLDGSYECALIPVAGDASAFYHPPSFDQINFLLSLRHMDRETIPASGTDLSAGIRALEKLDVLFPAPQSTTSLVIFISDGGQEELFAVDRAKIRQDMQILLSHSFRFHTIGVGTTTPVPLIQRDSSGNFEGYFIDPKTRKPFMSKLDENMLRYISLVGNGEYHHFSRKGELRNIVSSLVINHRELARTDYREERRSIRLWFFLTGITLFFFSQFFISR